MNKLLSVLVTMVLGLASAVVHAQGYYGGNFVFVRSSDDFSSDDASLKLIVGRLGMEFSETISGELRAGFGVQNDTIEQQSIEVDLDWKQLLGGYVRGSFAASDSLFYPYVVLGYSQVELEVSALGETVDDDETDFSYGIGGDLALGDTMKINLEYMNYFDKDGLQIDGFAFGLAKLF